MKALIEKVAGSLVSAGIHLLHNRDTPRFSREELRYLRLSFSAFGEDISLSRWFAEHFNIEQGTYVDVGAFHPIHCSNTLLLHKKGWRGVNIDMNADKVARFSDLRPDDVNVFAAVSNSSGFASSAQSGLIEHMIKDPNGSIPVQTLNEILSKTPYRTIDYLNVDCEGHDYEVIQSIDLDLYQPKIITIEALEETAGAKLCGYLTPRGYALKETLHYTMLFCRTMPPAT